MSTLDQLLKPRKEQPAIQHLPTTTTAQPVIQHLKPTAAPAAKTLPAKPPVTQTPPTVPKETCHSQPCYHLPEGYSIGQCQPSSLYIPVDLAKQTKLCTNPKTPYHQHNPPAKGANHHNSS